VYRCVDLRSGEIVAIKKLKKEYQSLDEAFSLREVQVLQSLSHPNVVQMKRVELQDKRLYIVFEHLEYNLTDFMVEKKKMESRSLTENEIKVIVK
jgi:protein kinase